LNDQANLPTVSRFARSPVRGPLAPSRLLQD
jgi:hypothetical protein